MLLNCGAGEDSWESLGLQKKIKTVNPKGNQAWIFIGRTDAAAEPPILWLPDAKSWVTGKDPDAEKDWRQMKKGWQRMRMVGWHHWVNGHGSEQTPEDSEGPGCCSPWGHKESDTTSWLNNNNTMSQFPVVKRDFNNSYSLVLIKLSFETTIWGEILTKETH